MLRNTDKRGGSASDGGRNKKRDENEAMEWNRPKDSKQANDRKIIDKKKKKKKKETGH